jgi:hypothetical protein
MHLGYYQLNQHKPWCDKQCSKSVDERTQAELQWLQDPRELNGNDLSNIRCEDTRQFTNNKREYLKDKLTSLQQTVRRRMSESCIKE